MLLPTPLLRGVASGCGTQDVRSRGALGGALQLGRLRHSEGSTVTLPFFPGGVGQTLWALG